MSSAPQIEGVYEVTGQSPVSRFIPGEGSVDGIEVKFRIPSISVNGSVWIQGETPDPETTRAAIRDWVGNALTIADFRD